MYDNIIGMPVTMRPVHLVCMPVMLVAMPRVMLVHVFMAFIMTPVMTIPTIDMAFITAMRFAGVTIMALATIILLIHTVFTTTPVVIISHRNSRRQSQTHSQQANQRQCLKRR